MFCPGLPLYLSLRGRNLVSSMRGNAWPLWVGQGSSWRLQTQNRSPKMKTSLTIAALMLTTSSWSVWAGTHTPRIDERQAHQEQRIDQGIASGELTRREAQRLDQQQDRIDRYENKAQADGRVTVKERARITHAQQHASYSIYRQKHDRQDRR
jgi:hypothetical protein